MRSLFLTLLRCRAISPARRLLSISGALLLMGNIAEARVTRIEVTRHEHFAGGQEFGNTGSYEKLVGRFYGELNPAAVLNTGIVDLHRIQTDQSSKMFGMNSFSITRQLQRPNCHSQSRGRRPRMRAWSFANPIPPRPKRLHLSNGNLSMRRPSASYPRAPHSQWGQSTNSSMRQRTRRSQE